MTLIEEKERVPCLTGGGGGAGRGDGKRRCWEEAGRHLLVAGWALGSWAGVNGLFVQLPLLVRSAPEGWALAAGLALAVQAANVGPLLYGALRRLGGARAPPDGPLIAALLALAALALLAAAPLHAVPLPLAGRPRSLPFLLLTWLTALVGCSSGVLCYPYLRHFPPPYLTSYLVGEGLGGLVPSLLALLQGVGGEPECVAGRPQYPEPRFSSRVYLGAVGAMVGGSCGAFLLLRRLRRPLKDCGASAPSAAKDEEALRAPGGPAGGPRCRRLVQLVLLAVLSSLLNGVLPALQPFACLPHGARAYHLAATLGAAAQPAACLAGVWLAPLSGRALTLLLLLSTAPLGLVLTQAVLIDPLLAGPTGSVLAVSCWVVAVSLLSYGRMWLLAVARSGGGPQLRAAGACSQAGSAAGSALMFLLVSYSSLFPQPSICPPPPLDT